MISKAIRKSFKRAKEKKWDKTFWAIDIHDTIMVPNWDEEEIPSTYFPHAKEVLQIISGREDITMILFTCSHPGEITVYLQRFAEDDIHFTYVNENPEVLSERYGNYDKKPYFNVLMEDKAGFDPNEDWLVVKALLEEYKVEK